MNMMIATLYLFVVLVSFSTTSPAHSFLITQHGLISSRFPEDKSNIATRRSFRYNNNNSNNNSNSNIRKNGITINNDSIRLQSSYQREPQKETAGGNRKINSEEDEEKELTLYEILRTSPTDTRSEIKSQYIALARISHPDAQISKEKTKEGEGEGGIDDKEDVVDFQQIAEAWRTLGNPQSRRKYDRELKAKEWGEKAQRLTNERLDQAVPIALNFLRRTTAVGQAIATGFSSSSSTSTSSSSTSSSSSSSSSEIESEDGTSNNTNIDINNDNNNSTMINNIDNDGISEMVHDQVVDDQVVSNGLKQDKTTETTLTDTFISALEAGRQAGRDVDTLELNEKSSELHEQ